ncbi:dynamin family protein [Salinisphaera sp. Q1T1-3]|uniref:dynamin family protein n=1 Tax=Salinisphaera sp. Q1T1-3 TaxID=2321229 RepID=UPI000E76E12A|nr:dynamin family protein [Salinisphaera sp. Q1T1-3]RJS91343.1 dynamin family protein [Salinisphaera sp. Q1T1-3]
MSNKRKQPTRTDSLESHLKRENPLLLEPLAEFRRLDRIAHRMRMLGPGESFTRRVSWWPVISLLGTFSAGKSSFINGYLGTALQRTGNQAVDDRFSVICYSDAEEARTLPGTALDADLRFPFYRISGDIEDVAAGEGRRINNYLQLKTCNSEKIRGKILLDSPGFDADSQRSATLQITDRIIDLSDLVLVFFDARHPEPGAMRDTLQHLVTDTIDRDDASKFVFVLNQIDTTAGEDNPEDVVAAWQRALASAGLSAGRFLRIYDEEAAGPIRDESLAARFKQKKDEDLAEIQRRMVGVEVDRAYRVVELMTGAASRLSGAEGVGRLKQYLGRWRQRVALYDLAGIAPLIALLVAGFVWAGNTTHQVVSEVMQGSTFGWVVVALVAIVLGAIHFSARRLAARQIAASIKPASMQVFAMDLRGAFVRNTRWWRSIFLLQPKGWTMFARKRVRRILDKQETMVRRLNDRFAQPSG